MPDAPQTFHSDVTVEVTESAGMRPISVALQWRSADGLARTMGFRLTASQARTWGLALLTNAKAADRRNKKRGTDG